MILEQRRRADHERGSLALRRSTRGHCEPRLGWPHGCPRVQGRSAVSPAVSSVLLTTERTQTSRAHPWPLMWLEKGVPCVVHMGDARSPASLAI